jgi:hypothetical protein
MALARSGRQMLRQMSSGLRYDLAIDNGVASMDGRRPYGVPYLGQIEGFGD